MEAKRYFILCDGCGSDITPMLRAVGDFRCECGAAARVGNYGYRLFVGNRSSWSRRQVHRAVLTMRSGVGT